MRSWEELFTMRQHKKNRNWNFGRNKTKECKRSIWKQEREKERQCERMLNGEMIYGDLNILFFVNK